MAGDNKSITNDAPGSSHSDGVQGADEQRTEMYDGTSKEQAQSATPQPAENDGSAISSANGQDDELRSAGEESMEEAILYAKKYLEDLLSFFGVNIDVYATTEDHEVIELDIPSTHLNGFLIGQHGDTMRSLQYLIGTALRNQGYPHNRVNVDVADYKKQRAERLVRQAEDWFREVRDSGKPKDLMPMNAAERRVLHQAATDYGLETESVGEGRDRHIVLKPGTRTDTEAEEPADEDTEQQSEKPEPTPPPKDKNT